MNIAAAIIVISKKYTRPNARWKQLPLVEKKKTNQLPKKEVRQKK